MPGSPPAAMPQCSTSPPRRASPVRVSSVAQSGGRERLEVLAALSYFQVSFPRRLRRLDVAVSGAQLSREGADVGGAAGGVFDLKGGDAGSGEFTQMRQHVEAGAGLGFGMLADRDPACSYFDL